MRKRNFRCALDKNCFRFYDEIYVNGVEKEEYADTIPREERSPAERCSEYDLWKVAFELRSQESRRTA